MTVLRAASNPVLRRMDVYIPNGILSLRFLVGSFFPHRAQRYSSRPLAADMSFNDSLNFPGVLITSTSFPTALYALTVLLAAVAYHVGFGNPPPALPDKERAEDVDYTPTLIDAMRWSLASARYLFSILAAAEVVACVQSVIVHEPSNNPRSFHRTVRDLCPADGAFDPNRRFPLLAWAGCLAHILGALFRQWGRRSLGRFFTWEVSLRPEHKLYTGGPYKIVRHPCYLGTTLIQTGQLMFAFSGETFTHECLKWRFPGAFHGIRLLVILLAVTLFGMSYRRVSKEDALLKKQFEKEWERWAEKTRSRLIPGIF